MSDTRRRRVAGEGSIYQRSDGRWVGAYDVNDEGERRRRKYVYGPTQRDVRVKLAAVRRQADEAGFVPPERLSLGTFLTDRWLPAMKPTWRPSTYRRHEILVRVHILPELGRKRLAALRPDDIESMLARKLAAGDSPRNVQYIRILLVSALKKALRWQLVSRNVAELTDGPHVPHHEVVPLTPKQARTLLDAAVGHPLESLLTVALSVGLRQGEALGLQWRDLDFAAGTLSVRRALQRIDGEYRLVETKTARSRRTIALPAVTLAALQAHRERQLAEPVRALKWTGWDLVFADSQGGPLHGPTVTRRFQALLAAAGLPRQRFHDLRHTCASFLLAQGVPMRVVMETLGHSQIGVTANIYSHVLPELQREAAGRMDALLAK